MASPTPESFFVTSSGTKIPFVPGWWDQSAGYPFGRKTFKEWAEVMSTEKAGASHYPTNLGFFINKLITADGLKNLLNEQGMVFSKKLSMLDLCSGPAITPRMFKSAGLVGYADAVDTINRYAEYAPDKVIAMQRELGDKLKGAWSSNGLLGIAKHLMFNEMNLPHSFSWVLDGADIEFLDIDNYFISDALECKYPRKYDLITLTSGREHFDPKQLYDLVYSLLNPGGVYLEVSCHWYSVKAGNLYLPLDAPWLHACMNFQDLMRYYRQHRPECLVDVKKVMYYPVTHYCLKDYVNVAEESGLNVYTARYHQDRKIVEQLSALPGGWRYVKDIVFPLAAAVNKNLAFEDLISMYYVLGMSKPR